MHFQYSVVKIALGRRIASGGQGKESELQATFSGRRTVHRLGIKKGLAEAKPGLCEIRGLAIRGQRLAEILLNALGAFVTGLQRSLSPINRGLNSWDVVN